MKRFRFACNLHFVATSINIDDIWIEYWWLFCSRITLHLTFPLQIASRIALIVLLLLLCPFLLHCVNIALQRYCKFPMALNHQIISHIIFWWFLKQDVCTWKSIVKICPLVVLGLRCKRPFYIGHQMHILEKKNYAFFLPMDLSQHIGL